MALIYPNILIRPVRLRIFPFVLAQGYIYTIIRFILILMSKVYPGRDAICKCAILETDLYLKLREFFDRVLGGKFALPMSVLSLYIYGSTGYFLGMVLVTIPAVKIPENGDSLYFGCPFLVQICISLALDPMYAISPITCGKVFETSLIFEACDCGVHFSTETKVSVLERLEIRIIFDDLEG